MRKRRGGGRPKERRRERKVVMRHRRPPSLPPSLTDSLTFKYAHSASASPVAVTVIGGYGYDHYGRSPFQARTILLTWGIFTISGNGSGFDRCSDDLLLFYFLFGCNAAPVRREGVRAGSGRVSEGELYSFRQKPQKSCLSRRRDCSAIVTHYDTG